MTSAVLEKAARIVKPRTRAPQLSGRTVGGGLFFEAINTRPRPAKRSGELMSAARKRTKTRLRSLERGILAGTVGTAAMTAHQEIRQRLERGNEQPQDAEQPPADDAEKDPWESAPAPAQVGKRLIEALLGRPVPAKAIPVLTQVMHWSYGSAWGGAYAMTRNSAPGRPRLLGPLFGLGVWAASYAELVPLGIYEPPWSYPLSSIADEIGYHLTYGAAVAVTYEFLARRVGA